MPVTGADVRNAIVLGLLLLAAGLVALYTARRKNA
ncbi:MAG: LPXTG cell wall anchor domain-containing protein [Flaviflexus sp.]